MINSAQHTLKGIVVADCMRRSINRLFNYSTISSAIATLVKYKISGLLVIDEDELPIGVVSKTNIVTAYYAGLPLDSPLEHIMNSPPLFCRADDPLEDALGTMKDNQVYRLYVKDPEDDSVIGALAYPDIVGLLYEFCSDCEQSLFNRGDDLENSGIERSRIGGCMTSGVESVSADESLYQVLEKLTMYHMGALLITDQSGIGLGVISKTDLILAYNHGIPLETLAGDIMSAPIKSCEKNDMLEKAIRSMIFSDIHRLFVKDSDSGEIIGVFSLTDAARCRSGSCHACISSRIQVAP